VLDSSPKSNDLPPGIRAGDIVANRYRLEEVVGRGGMGVVVAARHLELDERVAVKFMSPDALSDPEAIARFDREVKASARIRSEYVARVYDAGKLPDGRRYMVSEYLEGEDLSVRVHRGGPLQPEQAIRFLLQACSAVLEAHGLGIVHRDLKPANLRVVRRADGTEVIKVLDFGVMKRMPGTHGESETHETQPGTIVGTPLYTSPEQLRGSTTVDARSDVWSLGATLFELLAGEPPFSGKTYPQVIANVLEAPPHSLRAMRPEISEILEGVVLRCLEKRPDARYASIIDLAQALAETIDLDSEQKGLLERMLRQHRSPALGTPIDLDRRSEPTRDPPTPGFAVVGGHHLSKAPPSDRKIGTNGYRFGPRAGHRLLLLTIAALLTALAVVAMGLPLLPRFNPKVAEPGPTSAWQPQRETPAPPVLATIPDPKSSLPASISSSSLSASPTAGTPPSKSLPRRQPRPIDSTHSAAPTRNSDPAAQLPAPDAAPTARQRNPLLVRPR
jgi:eukaryotic-like serine/threonine-protein kinase